MSPHMNKCRQQERDSDRFVNWTPDTVTQKQKKQDSDEKKLQPSKRNKGPPKIDYSNGIQTTSPHTFSKVSFADICDHDSPCDLPELTCEPTFPPNSEHLYLMDNFGPGQPTQYQDLHDELEWLKDSNSTTNEHKLPPPGEGASFSPYLGSQPPLCSSTKDFDDNNDRSFNTNMVDPSNICLFADGRPQLAGSIVPNTAKPKDSPVKAKKPRITLRMPQREPRPNPKVSLRLSQPKQARAQRPIRRKPGVNHQRIR